MLRRRTRKRSSPAATSRRRAARTNGPPSGGPQFRSVRLRGLAFEAADQLREACDAFRRAVELEPSNRFVAGNLAATLAIAGQSDEARRIVKEMEEAAVGSPPPAMMLALVYHALGDDALAFAWLERALEAREFWLSMMHVDPMFRRMRGDARFQALVRRVGVARTS